MKYKVKRIKEGLYEYRGYKIMCLGYFEPEHRTAWEVVDVDGTAFGQSYTLRMAKIQVDIILDGWDGWSCYEKGKMAH